MVLQPVAFFTKPLNFSIFAGISLCCVSKFLERRVPLTGDFVQHLVKVIQLTRTSTYVQGNKKEP